MNEWYDDVVLLLDEIAGDCVAAAVAVCEMASKKRGELLMTIVELTEMMLMVVVMMMRHGVNYMIRRGVRKDNDDDDDEDGNNMFLINYGFSQARASHLLLAAECLSNSLNYNQNIATTTLVDDRSLGRLS